MSTAVKHDAFSKMLAEQIENGIAKINTANETLLAEETGTSVRDIDKALKAEFEKITADESFTSDLPESVLNAWRDAQSAYEVYKKNVEVARNTYRTDILGEDAKDTSGDVDKEAVKEVRKVVMDAIQFLSSYAKGNGRKDLEEWAGSIAVPQVGRQGVSSVGTKKPRVYVAVGDKVYNSFSETAAALSDKDNKIAASDLSAAWAEAGGNEGEYKFGDHVLKVTFKPKASEGK